MRITALDARRERAPHLACRSQLLFGWCLRVVLLGALSGSAHPLLADSFSVSTFSVPGALNTIAYGISNDGEIVGSAWTQPGEFVGFVDSGGTIVTDPVPGYESSFFSGINDSGEIVGEIGIGAGFSGSIENGFSILSFPDPTFGQLAPAYGINDLGQIVGGATDYEPENGGYVSTGNSGFLYSDGTVTTLNPLGFYSVARGINDVGQIVLYSNTDNFGVVSEQSYIRQADGELVELPTVAGALSEEAYGINDSGEVVGTVKEGSGHSDGFIYSDGLLTTFDVPGASGTEAYGVNDKGEIVGCAMLTSGACEGFVATPLAESEVPEPESIYLFLAGALLPAWIIYERRRRGSA